LLLPELCVSEVINRIGGLSLWFLRTRDTNVVFSQTEGHSPCLTIFYLNLVSTWDLSMRRILITLSMLWISKSMRHWKVSRWMAS
jgi:hypothetical protein